MSTTVPETEKPVQGVLEVEDVKQSLNTISYTKEEERRTLRKLDFWLVGLLGSLYLVSYIDRSNIGNAYTAGMGKTWGITSNDYSWIITMYYITYILGQPLILLWKVVNLPVFVSCIAVGWGAMSMIQAAANSFAGLMVLRFLIGVFEAGFGPGVALYYSFWYHRHEQGLRYGLWISFSALASCFASALAYGLVQAKAAIAGWKLLFIVEGAPTLLLAVVAYFLLPNGPGQCRFLNDRENQIVASRAIRARGDDSEKRLNFRQVGSAFYDYKNYLQAAIVFCLNTAFGSLPAFLPTIIEDIGFTSIKAQGLSAPPYLAAWVVCIAASFASDRLRNRGIFITILCLTGGVGYVLLATVDTVGVRYFGCFLACIGCFPAVAITFTWVTDNQGSASKRGAGLAIFGMIGQCGPILGSRIFPTSDGPKYVKGMSICAGVLFGAALIAVILSLCLFLQNRARDKKHGKSSLDHIPVDVTDIGDDHPMYRYVL
ncbi:MFS general substrate transporter [Rhizodiscina lignyota]|uniref:MFS general substrate transporter n=1 Tax=Rhizodiscina lignyota TaxID=1504668 RepID=A0A9P4M1U5_9PEZI|nr:MFS general substrate transporter [Rhizodiscina lignyota]